MGKQRAYFNAFASGWVQSRWDSCTSEKRDLEIGGVERPVLMFKRCQFWCQFVLGFRALCCALMRWPQRLSACVYKTMHLGALTCADTR